MSKVNINIIKQWLINKGYSPIDCQTFVTLNIDDKNKLESILETTTKQFPENNIYIFFPSQLNLL